MAGHKKIYTIGKRHRGHCRRAVDTNPVAKRCRNTEELGSDGCMDAFKLEYVTRDNTSKVMSCSKGTIAKPTQADHLVFRLSVGFPVRQIFLEEWENRERPRASQTGCVSAS